MRAIGVDTVAPTPSDSNPLHVFSPSFIFPFVEFSLANVSALVYLGLSIS